MATTNFPNGISYGGEAVQSGLAIVGTGAAGTVTTTLDTCTRVECSLGTALGTAVFNVAGTAHVNAAGASTFILRTYNSSAGAATAAAPVCWTAYGTKA